MADASEMDGVDPRPESVPQAADFRSILRDADGIQMVYQPVVALASGQVVGYEALARFPSLPRWPVAAVFSHASDLGMGPALEASAIARALEPIGRPIGTQPSLNVSPAMLASGAILDVLPQFLGEIVIEVTEHEQVSGDAAIAAALRELRERGARIAIDDAGVGYSGLQQLVNVWPDIVKLDRELIFGIRGDEVRIALVEALVRFAHRIGTHVCAEGVEDLEDLAALADLDVDCAQGYALARPSAPWASVSPVAVDVCRGALERALRSPHAEGEELVVGTMERGLEWASRQLSGARSTTALEEALEAIASDLSAINVTLSRWIPEEAIVETLAETGEGSGATRFPVIDYPLTAQVLRSQDAAQVLLSDPATDDAEVKLLLELGHRLLLMVPVIARGETLGLLEAYSDEERPWTRAQINHARIIANQFASVIEAFLRVPGV